MVLTLKIISALFFHACMLFNVILYLKDLAYKLVNPYQFLFWLRPRAHNFTITLIIIVPVTGGKECNVNYSNTW
jgi:hypothetical protein